jgi:hypothetical protein
MRLSRSPGAAVKPSSAEAALVPCSTRERPRGDGETPLWTTSTSAGWQCSSSTKGRKHKSRARQHLPLVHSSRVMHLNADDCIQGESSSVLGMWFTAVPSRVEGVALMSLPRSQEELWDARRVNRGAPREVAGRPQKRGGAALRRSAARSVLRTWVRPEPRVVGSRGRLSAGESSAPLGGGSRRGGPGGRGCRRTRRRRTRSRYR